MAHVLDEGATYHLPPGVVSILDAAIDFVYSFEPLVAKTVVLGTINYTSWARRFVRVWRGTPLRVGLVQE
jgi:hypothetical protein